MSAATPEQDARRGAIPQFLAQLERAVTPPEKEALLFRFAATLDTVFYDLPAAPATRHGNALERDVQALLEAAFSVLQLRVPPEHTVEPPARFAALRALGAFVQGTAPVPTVLSEDWRQPHVPLYLAALRLLTALFEKGTTQYVFAIRCLGVMGIQALQVLSPLDPVDNAVSTILSSPTRSGAAGASAAHHHQHQNSTTATNLSNTPNTSIAGASQSDALNSTATSIAQQAAVAPSPSSYPPSIANDSIMQAPAVSPIFPPTGTPLRIVQPQPGSETPQRHIELLGDESSTTPRSEKQQQQQQQQQHCESFLNFESLFMDHLLTDPILRPLVVDLWRMWDAAGIDVRVFTACPESVHVYFPTRLLSSVSCVFRDFITCPARPKMDKPWSGQCEIHIKTNIAAHSEVMFRVLVEGYNYGVNSPIHSELVGCAKRHWDAPAGGDEERLAEMCRDYAAGARSTQYYSRDGYLVLKLVAKSFFGVGFTASAWMVFHGHHPGFAISAEVFHQEEDL